MTTPRGKFITLEGMDGAGKSTHLEPIAGLLRARGHEVCVTREPGGTPLGEMLRELMLAGNRPLRAETEALMMFAARFEHLDKIIRPALDAGTWVLCDRFTDATYAYQSAGSGLAWEKIAALEAWVHGDLQPDLTFYFDVPAEVGVSRTRAVREPDRFEREQGAYFNRVREGYLRRARENPQRVTVIDSTRALNDIKKEVEGIVITYCKK